MAENWNMSGTYFEACNCATACPCLFLSTPTDGECTALVAWHIDSGSFGNVNLDGLNVALAVHSPGHMMEVKWKVALYLGDNANQDQQNTLGQIFSGQAGGHFAKLAAHIGEVVGVKTVPIDYQADGKKRSLKIPNTVQVDIEGIEGQGGNLITIENHPLAIAPGQTATVAKSKGLSYHDHGMDWEISGKTGIYSPFKYEGP
ncbi:MAG: DUF1326 domain-containing protein [Chloroflexi bacterium]|nr:DUF1326 domain-containing protein [Chloroflexota bacterium]